MPRPKSRRPSPALVISLIAMFVALGSGAYAASKIGTSQLKNKAVTTKKLDNKAATGSKIAKDAVKKNKIKDEAVTGSKLGEQAVAPDNLANPTFWAYVQGGNPPSLVRGLGAGSVSRSSTGNYRVLFDPALIAPITDLTQCAYGATPTYRFQGRLASADLDPTVSNQVIVTIRRGTTDALTDNNANFNLAVYC